MLDEVAVTFENRNLGVVPPLKPAVDKQAPQLVAASLAARPVLQTTPSPGHAFLPLRRERRPV